MPDTDHTDADLELRRLRLRAFGPHPDIADDPIALARLIELEDARIGLYSSVPPADVVPSAVDTAAAATALAAASPTGDGPLPINDRPRITAKPRRGRILAVSAALAACFVITMAMLVPGRPGPRPEATMRLSGTEPDENLLTLMESEGSEFFGLDRSALRGASEMEIDLSTLRAFGTYRGIELWAAVNVFDSPCLIAVHRNTENVVARGCVPPEAELFIDTEGHGLAGGERLRFVLRGDTVDVHFLVPEGAG